MAYLLKFIALPLYPLGLVMVVWLVGVLAFFYKKKSSIWCFIVAGILLFLFSTRTVSNFLIEVLEKRYYSAQDLPDSCSAIVVLGGGGKMILPLQSGLEINDAGDRIIHGARLYKKGVCHRLITTGGWVDPAFKNTPPEGLHNALLLMEMGVDSSDIIIEKNAKNTHEHGPYIAQILDSLHLPRKIILVTSASHMIRSEAVFKKCGFIVYPAPTDYQKSSGKRAFIFNLFPNSGSLDLSNRALHEFYGILGYKLLGWI
ncbi:MAG TPA: YdcF family protein [Chitinispirillaceae bacterium]|nr:YdcF family protein [Chitinispirillaceae bacterium]